MKTLSILLSLLFISVTSFGQGGTTPDWANKQGGIGIGANGSMGSSSKDFPDGDQTRKGSSTFAGLYATYNVLSFLNLRAGFAVDNSNSETDQTGDFPYYQKSEYKGKTISIIAGFPIFGSGLCCNPDCRFPLAVSPVIGYNRWKGTEFDVTKYDMSPKQEWEGDLTSTTINLGVQAEYFWNLSGLQISTFILCNLLETQSTVYDDKDNEAYNSKETNVLGNTQVFGRMGFTFWFR